MKGDLCGNTHGTLHRFGHDSSYPGGRAVGAGVTVRRTGIV